MLLGFGILFVRLVSQSHIVSNVSASAASSVPVSNLRTPRSSRHRYVEPMMLIFYGLIVNLLIGTHGLISVSDGRIRWSGCLVLALARGNTLVLLSG